MTLEIYQNPESLAAAIESQIKNVAINFTKSVRLHYSKCRNVSLMLGMKKSKKWFDTVIMHPIENATLHQKRVKGNTFITQAYF